jgi:hypothetical protein
VALSPSRFHIYFTPTSSSRLNMVERLFRDLTQNRLRRGVFRDVEDLITAIDDYVDKHNDKPKPFIWIAKASDILEKVTRARAQLDNAQSIRRRPLDRFGSVLCSLCAERWPGVRKALLCACGFEVNLISWKSS